jgi:hypothetical protein
MTENRNQGNQWPNRYSNRAPPECVSIWLPLHMTAQLCSVRVWCWCNVAPRPKTNERGTQIGMTSQQAEEAAGIIKLCERNNFLLPCHKWCLVLMWECNSWQLTPLVAELSIVCIDQRTGRQVCINTTNPRLFSSMYSKISTSCNFGILFT